MPAKKIVPRSSTLDIQDFLATAARIPPRTASSGGRLMLALDATASREATWDQACHLQAQMFLETQALGGLAVQLCWYRGFREFYTTPWVNTAKALLQHMAGVRCIGGRSQIKRVLHHAIEQVKGHRGVQAVVFIGDCVEETPDILCDAAGQLGLLRTPLFIFQEGHDRATEHTFREMARLSKGAYYRFDADAVDKLRQLLAAVAVYASGGHQKLSDFAKRHGSAAVLQLTHQLER